MILFIDSRRICNNAGFDCLASKKDGELIELNSEMSLDDAVVETFLR